MINFFPIQFLPQEIIPNLYQSGLIVSPSLIRHAKLDVIIDLEGGFDNKDLAKFLKLYLYWPIEDGPLPDNQTLQQISLLGSFFLNRRMRILVHCFFGMNRSSLVTGMIMWRMGYKGEQIVKTIKEKIPLALTNEVFKNHLEAL